jgi:hypothetical protein
VVNIYGYKYIEGITIAQTTELSTLGNLGNVIGAQTTELSTLGDIIGAQPTEFRTLGDIIGARTLSLVPWVTELAGGMPFS